MRFDGLTGSFQGVFAQGGGLQGPVGMSFGPGGDLFVADFVHDAVYRYDGMTGAAKGVFASAGGLDFPTYIAFKPVPEPSSLVLLGVGAVGIAWKIRRRRR